MRLPTLPDNSGALGAAQTAFAGVDYRYGAGNGAIVEELGCSSAWYPYLSSRPARRYSDANHYRGSVRMLEHPNGMAVFGGEPNGDGYVGGHHYMVDGNTLLRNGIWETTGGQDFTITLPHDDAAAWVSRPRTLVGMGRRLVVWPDKVMIELDEWENKVVKPLGAAVGGNGFVFRNGSYAGEDAEANTIYAASVNWADYFAVGDGVSISFSGAAAETYAKWSGTFIVREIDGHELRFYEHTFDPPEGVTLPVTVGSYVGVGRRVPDLDFLCEQGNRLWGCKGDTIYCSKLGDPTNWNVFDGISTDAWSVDTGSPGGFTGCCSYLGYPCFFKADAIYKVYGTRPENFELVGGPNMGVRPGCGKSLAIVGDVLYYVSRVGVTAWTGGLPRQATDRFGDIRLTDAVGGSDGRCYYLSARDARTGVWSQWVLDTQTGLLSREEETWRDEWDEAGATAPHADFRAVGFGFYNGGVLRMLRDGETLYTGEDRSSEDYEPGTCMVEFGDWDYVSLTSRSGAAFAALYPVRLWVRIAAAEGATVTISVRYDGGEWEEAASRTGEGKRKDTYMPVPVRRCRRYALKLEVTGTSAAFKLLAIERELVAESKARR